MALLATLGCRPADDIITLDGSSTVYPIAEAAAESYTRHTPARITIGVSGTGGGFKKFCAGEVKIVGASRPITETELAHCDEAGVGFIELPIAYDGIVVAVHPSNDWLPAIRLDDLRAMWAPKAQAEVLRWSDVRPDWPDRPLHLFGPGVDSGTYDYFTQAVVGRRHASRGDFTSSEDDNVLVQGLSTDPVGLGFFGFAYYVENASRVKAVPVDAGEGPVAPSRDTIGRGTYRPLSRPVFVYVRADAAEDPAVAGFVDDFVARCPSHATAVGYVGLSTTAASRVAARWRDRITGTRFGGPHSVIGRSVEEVLP